MSPILSLLAEQADGTALETPGASIDAATLRGRVIELADRLRDEEIRCAALLADNGIDWIVADLACLEAGVRIVPVPLFFSAEQVRHVLASSGADTLLTDQPVGSLELDLEPVPGMTPLPGLRRYALEPREHVAVPDTTWKITYTSGTTGAPKGVCLSAEHLMSVAASVAQVTGLESPRHLAVLPMSTLLENVAGVYAPLLAGGTVVVPSLGDVGLRGSSSLDVQQLLDSITAVRPDSLILVPEILRVVTIAAERGWRPSSSLRFVAVGGSKTAPGLIERSRQAGIPIFEGYGLSECGSVTTLNTPGNDRAGSVGRALPHTRISITDGEICVAGSTMLGYVDQPASWYPDLVPTGDIGHIDGDGFVHIDGRARNLIITGYGRNVSPEWVESELLAGPLLAQAIVFGDARPWCSALLLPSDPDTSDAGIASYIRQVNDHLPDYARVVDWRRLPAPLCEADGLLTNNGRPQRPAIEARYGALIDEMYTNQPEVVNQ